MYPKDADGMANSVDPDQTASSEAVWSWSALFAETYLSQYIEFVRYCHSYESAMVEWSEHCYGTEGRGLDSQFELASNWKAPSDHSTVNGYLFRIRKG